MEDKRLERLYDYTKWHIGIYLASAAGLTAALGLLAPGAAQQPNLALVQHPVLLLSSVLLMFGAGTCGAVVASSCTECLTYDDLWIKPQGPFGLRLLQGRRWAAMEHLFFWASVAAAALAVLTSSPVRTWLKW